jgi:hypothetical protein
MLVRVKKVWISIRRPATSYRTKGGVISWMLVRVKKVWISKKETWHPLIYLQRSNFLAACEGA